MQVAPVVNRPGLIVRVTTGAGWPLGQLGHKFGSGFIKVGDWYNLKGLTHLSNRFELR